VTVPAESPSTSLIWIETLPNKYLLLDSNPAPEKKIKQNIINYNEPTKTEETNQRKQNRDGTKAEDTKTEMGLSSSTYQSNCQA